MSFKYNEYLNNHRDNLYKGFNWLKENIPDIFKQEEIELKLIDLIHKHDDSMFTIEEYEACDNYYYECNTKCGMVDDDTENKFNVAWLHHLHNNPHHWQYWIMYNDDPSEREIYLEIPYEYILEMILDWWAFSWAKNDLYEIFNWYDINKSYLRINFKSKMEIEKILEKMKRVLDE